MSAPTTTGSSSSAMPISRSQRLADSQVASHDTEGPTDAAPYRQVPPRLSLTRSQFAALKSGAKVDIVIGPVSKQHVAVKNASVGLLKQYCGLAREQLSHPDTTCFHLPNGAMGAVAWAYRYMQARERNPPKEVEFEHINMSNLAHLFITCNEMQYEHLANKTFNRLKYLLRTRGCSDPDTISMIYTHAPALCDEFAEKIAGIMFEGTYNLDPILVEDLLAADGFGELLSSKLAAKEAILAKHGKHAFLECYMCGHKGHISRECNTPLADYRGVAQVNVGTAHGAQQPVSIKYGQSEPIQQYREAPTCYNCNKVGHIARDCKVPKNSGQKGKRGGKRSAVIQVPTNGEGISTYDYEVKAGQYTRTGLLI